MPGALCPKCGQKTFYKSTEGKECTKCGYKVVAAVHGGKGGKGQKCPICGKYTFYNGKCRSCGAREA